MTDIKIALLGLGTVGSGVVKVLLSHGAEMQERAGCRLVLARRFSASGFLTDVRRHGCTLFNYVGSPLAYIMATPERADDTDNSLRLWSASLRAGGKIHYDAANMKVTTPSSANAFLSREYPQGWNLTL